MKIALCVKQVPDTDDIKWTENNTMQREGVESIINPYDVYAIEAALKLNGQITVYTMGPLQAAEMLKSILALGADKGVLISDKKFAGADTFATGKTISAAIKKDMPDLIICGQFATDGDTGQTGPCIASLLGIPQVTFVKEIIECSNNKVKVLRVLEDGEEKVEVTLPALICILKSDFEPSRAKINGIIKAQETEIEVLTLEDLDLTADEAGIKGSPTYVSKAFRPKVKHFGQKYEGAEIIYDKLKEIGVING